MEEESRAIVAREIGDLVFVEVVAPRYDARRTNEIETENGRASPAFNLLSLSLSLSLQIGILYLYTSLSCTLFLSISHAPTS